MYQALAALLGAIFTVAACYACGALLIDRFDARLYRPERFPLAFLLGASVLHLAIFVILALHIGYWPVVLAPLLAVMALATVKGSWRLRGDPMKPLSKHARIFSGVLFGAFMVLDFFHAWAPENSPDGSGYHLSLVARYLRDRGFERITTNFYSSLSQGMEMLFVPAFAIGKHSAAALFHLAFSVALALLIVAYGRRLGKPWAGLAGAFLTFASPVVGIDASSAYNDVASGAVVFAVFYWLQVWDEQVSDGSRHDQLLIPIGLLSGYAYAIKYTAVLILPFALAFVAWRARKLRPVLAIAALSLVMIAPWMLKNWVEVRNPVAPFGNAIFRNPYMHVSDEQDLARQMNRYGVENKWTLPQEVIIRGARTNGLLGPIFFALPLALLALRERAGRRLVAAGLILFATFFANVGTRFLIPALPFFSLAMVIPLAGAPVLLGGVMLFHAATSWPTAVQSYAPNAWGLDRILWKQALRVVPQDDYLKRMNPNYGIARMIEAYVPKGERVFAPSGISDSYTTREVLVSFRSGETQVLQDAIDVGWDEDRQPGIQETFSFPERMVRRVRVLQHASVPDPLAQWSVHELRFFDKGAEVPRSPDWRLQAWPNPWDVQLAFDNSAATRWRTWEPLAPGDYIDVDFGSPRPMDQVHVETSFDYFNSKLTLEAMDDAGKWIEIGKDPAISQRPKEANTRREATDFLKSRGIHYLLIQDHDFQAIDMRGDPEGWGLTEVASGYGGRIFRVQ
jgi:hypothetical protein